MTGLSPTGLPPIAGGESRAADPGAARGGLRTAQQAAQRAGAFASADDARTIAGIERLRQSLASGNPLRTDVPRGYHLDITV